MKVFVAGASGAIGRRLVPQLVARGHDVVAMTRTREKEATLRELGAEPVVADGLDRASVREAVLRAEPEVVIHQMTALTGVTYRKVDEELATTNRLRTAGIDYLLDAARAAGARRFVAQSFGEGLYAGDDAHLRTEEDPPDHPPLASARETLEAIRHVESAVPRADGLEGLVLRYGFFYGPGTGLAIGGEILEAVRHRKFPIVGDGAGVWSFIHIDDAAAATVAALKHGAPGVYNVVDDEPAPVAVWLPELAKTLGAKAPRRVPELVGRLAAGEWLVYLSRQIAGLSNEKAKRELDWRPRYATWRDGFRRGLADAPVEAVAAAS